MAKTALGIGAHYDDCVFGIPGIMLQAIRKHYKVVILSVIGDCTNWAPVKGREKEFVKKVTDVSREYGAEMQFLKYAAHRFDVALETKKAVAEVVAEVQPEVAFIMWPRDTHHDHEVAGTLGKITVQHGDRVLDGGNFRPARAVYAFDNGPRHNRVRAEHVRRCDRRVADGNGMTRSGDGRDGGQAVRPQGRTGRGRASEGGTGRLPRVRLRGRLRGPLRRGRLVIVGVAP